MDDGARAWDGFERDEDGALVEPDHVPGGWEQYEAVRPDAPAPGRAVGLVVGLMVAQWRFDRGLSQREAAPVFGMDQPRLSRVERGRARVDLELLVGLVAATGSHLSLTVAAEGAGPPVRRLARPARAGRAAVRVAVDGPEARWAPGPDVA